MNAQLDDDQENFDQFARTQDFSSKTPKGGKRKYNLSS